MRLESINTNQVARVNKATIRSELSSMRWHTEMPAGQEKAGEMPHTLHKRRPQNNPDKNKCTQTAPQTLSQDNLDKARKGAEDKSKHQKRQKKGQGWRQREKLQQSKQMEVSEETTKQPEENPEIP